MQITDPQNGAKDLSGPSFAQWKRLGPPTPSLPSQAVPHDRIAWIDVAKGTTILLVVLFHTQIYLAHQGLGFELYDLFNKALRPVRMPLFFALSGVLAASLIRKSWGTVLKRRVWLFLYLFVLWSAIHILAFKYVLWHPVFEFRNAAAWELMMGMIRPRTAIWFIWALAFYVLFAKTFRSVPILAALLSCAFGLLGASGVLLANGFTFMQQSLFFYLPFFVIPALYGKALLGWATAQPLTLFLAGVALTGMSRLAPDIAGLRIDNAVTGLTQCLGGLSAGIAASVFLSGFAPTRAFFSYFGARTLPIYIVHILFLSILTSIASAWYLPGMGLYATPLVTVCVVALSLGFHKLMCLMGQGWLFQPPRIARTEKPAPQTAPYGGYSTGGT